MTLRPSRDGPDILRRLIASDTTSRNSNLELIDYMKSLLDGHSIPFRLTHDDEGSKANLLATLGPEDAPGGYILCGHTDIEPLRYGIGRAVDYAIYQPYLEND